MALVEQTHGGGQNAIFSPEIVACVSLGGIRGLGGDKQLVTNIKNSVQSLQHSLFKTYTKLQLSL